MTIHWMSSRLSSITYVSSACRSTFRCRLHTLSSVMKSVVHYCMKWFIWLSPLTSQPFVCVCRSVLSEQNIYFFLCTLHYLKHTALRKVCLECCVHAPDISVRGENVNLLSRLSNDMWSKQNHQVMVDLSFVLSLYPKYLIAKMCTKQLRERNDVFQSDSRCKHWSMLADECLCLFQAAIQWKTFLTITTSCWL